MHPPDCPAEWKYETHPNCAALSGRISALLASLASGDSDTSAVAADTRPCHEKMFTGLTPNACEYYAGNYRGAAFRCLRFVSVGIKSDPRVGAPPAGVNFLMQELSNEIRTVLLALDGNVLLTAEQQLRYLVALAAHVFVAFLTIHPYVNGNGHAGRLIVWSVFRRYGYWPKNWPVEPRPPDPPYSTLIVSHRDGNHEPLEKFFLQSLLAT